MYYEIQSPFDILSVLTSQKMCRHFTSKPSLIYDHTNMQEDIEYLYMNLCIGNFP